MSATTVNAFPPLHAFNASRSWFIAAIVLVHLGFFWGLTHGVTSWTFDKDTPPVIVNFVPTTRTPPPPTPPPQQVEPVVSNVFTPHVETPTLPPIDLGHEPVQTSSEPQLPPPPAVPKGPGAGPLIVEPELDPRYPFTEPEYPVSEIRQGHEGTVLLSLQILPNGHVGEVRVDQSSGYAKLDDAAAREARKWRMKAGTRDGTALAMWKRVPIKFQLKN